MERQFTLEYWLDDGWYVGRIQEFPGVFSQGESIEELEENVRDAYRLVAQEGPQLEHTGIQRKEISVDVA